MSSDWVVEFQKIMFRIALVNAKLEELRKVKVRCDCPWVDWRIKDLERELKSLLKMHALMVVCVTHHVASRVGQALIRSYVKLRREMVGVLYPQNGGVKE